MIPYHEFLRAKIPVAPDDDPEKIVPLFFDPEAREHQDIATRWLVEGGRRALFASFGLGKTRIQLRAVKSILMAHGGRGLIVLPLGVRQEFTRDAAAMGLTIRFIRRIEEAEADGLYMTNYETVRDGKLDPRLFTVCSLDEAAVLRGFGGTKTFREFMRLFEGVRFKFVATATPSPNEYIELLAYAAFLEVMDVGQGKTRFFKRDSTNADKLTLHPHKAEEFWLWVSSWALFIQKPSDLGFSDEGYALPPLKVHYHTVTTELIGKEADRGGQLMLIRDHAIGVQGAAKEKRDTLPARIEAMKGVINDYRRKARLSESVLRKEQGSAACSSKGTEREELSREPRDISSQNESVEGCEPGKDGGTSKGAQGERPAKVQGISSGALSGEQAHSRSAGAGAKAKELWADGRALSFHGGGSDVLLRDLRGEDGEESLRGSLPQDGKSQGPSLSKVQCRSRPLQGQSGNSDEGCGLFGDQIVIWVDLNDEQRAVEAALGASGISYSSIYGSLTTDECEKRLSQWRERKTSVLIAKPVMLGSGVNLQQCNKAIFLGIGFKFYEFIQAVHRVHRFLQTRPCEIHIIYAESEQAILRTLLRKWEQHKIMVAKMSDIIREFGLSHAAMAKALERSIGCKRLEVSGDKYRLVNADCVEETQRMEADSVGLIVTSIPFSTQYEYSPSYNDFGHTDDDRHFWAQMDYLVPQLFRVLKPGRDAAIHVKDRIIPGGVSGLGFQTLSTFSYDCISAFRKHGFAYLGEKTITTDVVRENNQTYRLGWTEQCKDGSRMGFGVPEKLLLFRKPPTSRENGYADEPVVKLKKWRVDAREAHYEKDQETGEDVFVEAKDGYWLNPDGYSRGRWQLDAHAYTRSSGDRLITSDELIGFEASDVFKRWKAFSLETVYNFEHHVRICEAFEERGRLPANFMLMPPHSRHPDVWTDITRMLSANTLQSARGAELHLCPLQFDIVDRAINQWSNTGDVVFDPFGGLMTVPMRAVRFGRVGWGVELNHRYFLDGCAYVEAEARKFDIPTLFDALDAARAPKAIAAE